MCGPCGRWAVTDIRQIERFGIKGALSVASLVGVVLPLTMASAHPYVFSDGRSAYTAITPCRLADTRETNGTFTTIGTSIIRIQVRGRCSVGDSTSAVAVSLTVTDTHSDGYAVANPAMTTGPSSTINWTRGETRAASTVVALSGVGAIDVHVSSLLDDVAVIVDVTGAWSPVSGPVRGGRLISSTAQRALDTRGNGNPVAAGHSITVDRVMLGIPDSAVAVTGTLTTTNASGPGFLTAYPAGSSLPVASNVNNDSANQDRAAGTIVALGAAGISFYAGAASADIIFDVNGYVTGDTDAASTEGLLIAVASERVLDTRVTTDPITTSAVTEVGVPFPTAQIAGIVATLTASDGIGAGYATFGSPSDGSPTSALNWPGGSGAVAAMTVQPVPASNRLAITSSTPASLIVDVTAYLLAANAPTGPEVLAPGTTALTTGSIVDTTGTGRANGDPIVLLEQVYSANVLAAGGGVSIATSEIPGGGAALVPYDATNYPACGPEPRCMLVSAGYWDSPDRGGIDANRVMIAHEWAHVLSFRFQSWVDGATLASWIARRDAVNEECLADAVAALALQRAGLPGNETPTYAVHYMCDQYWSDHFGADAVEEMRAEAATLAADLLNWSDAWGTAHRG